MFSDLFFPFRPSNEQKRGARMAAIYSSLYSRALARLPEFPFFSRDWKRELLCPL